MDLFKVVLGSYSGKDCKEEHCKVVVSFSVILIRSIIDHYMMDVTSIKKSQSISEGLHISL